MTFFVMFKGFEATPTPTPPGSFPGPSYYDEIPYFRGHSNKGKRTKEELERIWKRRERERQEEESFLVFLTEVIND